MNPLDVKLDKHTTCATGFFFLTVSKRMEICKEVLSGYSVLVDYDNLIRFGGGGFRLKYSLGSFDVESS